MGEVGFIFQLWHLLQAHIGKRNYIKFMGDMTYFPKAN